MEKTEKMDDNDDEMRGSADELEAEVNAAIDEAGSVRFRLLNISQI